MCVCVCVCVCVFKRERERERERERTRPPSAGERGADEGRREEGGPLEYLVAL